MGTFIMSLLLVAIVINVPLSNSLVHSVVAENQPSTDVSQSSNGSCPPWYIPDGEQKCSFSNQLPQIMNQYEDTAELEIGYCMTVTNSSQVVSQCPYMLYTRNFNQFHSIYQVLPSDLDEVNASMCSVFNRKGFLCSECKEGYGLAAYRYYGLICVKCSSSVLKWVGFILLEFIPPTLIFLVILIFGMNVSSGGFTGYIFFAHVIIATVFFYPSLVILPQSLFGNWPIQILLALYGIWSLNFMHFVVTPFCMSPRLRTLQLISLGYISSLYPLLLCIITYSLIELHARDNWLLIRIWRPFHTFFVNTRRPWNIQSSIIHSFATFILLSYGKNVFISFTLIQGHNIVELDVNTNTLRTMSPRSVDLGAPYFGATHAPYGTLGLFVGVITILLPLVLVLLYPTRVFPKLTGCCGLRRWHAIRAFMEVFVGSYNDGKSSIDSDIKRDYRFMAGVYLIGRISIGVGWAKLSPNSPVAQHYSWFVTAVPFILAAVFFAFFKPHRQWSHNIVDILMFLLLAKVCIFSHIMFEMSITDEALRVVVIILMIDLAIPQVALIVYFGYKIACSARIQDLKRLCVMWRRKRLEGESENIPHNHECQPQANDSQLLPCDSINYGST